MASLSGCAEKHDKGRRSPGRDATTALVLLPQIKGDEETQRRVRDGCLGPLAKPHRARAEFLTALSSRAALICFVILHTLDVAVDRIYRMPLGILIDPMLRSKHVVVPKVQ